MNYYELIAGFLQVTALTLKALKTFFENHGSQRILKSPKRETHQRDCQRDVPRAVQRDVWKNVV